MLEFIISDKFYLPIIYIIIGVVIYVLISSFVKRAGNVKLLSHNKDIDKRKSTIVLLINNIIKYLIAIIIVLAILKVYGVNTTSLIASLGIIGVVVGLAFQDIVKDFLAGISIIFDNQYVVGDWVSINGFKGEVIAVGLKTTKIKSMEGDIKIISNSAFNEVINYSVSNDFLYVYIPVSYDVDIDKLEEVLNKIKDNITSINKAKKMELLGIDSFDASSMNYVIRVECMPMSNLNVKRALLIIIKKEFDKNKIVIPYNQLDVHIER